MTQNRLRLPHHNIMKKTFLSNIRTILTLLLAFVLLTAMISGCSAAERPNTETQTDTPAAEDTSTSVSNGTDAAADSTKTDEAEVLETTAAAGTTQNAQGTQSAEAAEIEAETESKIEAITEAGTE